MWDIIKGHYFSFKFAIWITNRSLSFLYGYDLGFYHHSVLKMIIMELWNFGTGKVWFLGTVQPFVSLQKVMFNMETRVYMKNFTRS